MNADGSEGVLSDYREALERADLSGKTRRAYGSRVAGFLDWLDEADAAAALSEPAARDHAVRDYRSWLRTVGRAQPSTLNAHLTALDHFFGFHLGIGRPVVRRERIVDPGPKALEEAEQRRFLRATADARSTRNRAIAYLLFYSGIRVEEAEALDVDDISISARRGKVIVRKGKGDVYREVPLHRVARVALRAWLDERRELPGASTTKGLFLNRLGGRLLVRSLRAIVSQIGVAAGLVDDNGKSLVGPHTLRHTFATRLRVGGADIVVIAALLGHSSINTTSRYTVPSESERAEILERVLLVDE